MAQYARRSFVDSSGLMPPGVKWLLIANVAIFLFNFLLNVLRIPDPLFLYGALVPGQVLRAFAVWQLVTYLFLHGGILHILLNMLSLWMFGRELEAAWGTKRFLQFYFLCGVGAGLCVILANLIFPSGEMASRTIGASGAIYGLMLAYAILYPDREIIFYFVPLKAKYFVLILGSISFILTFSGQESGVSHVAHLGGMIFAYGYLKSRYLSLDLMGLADRAYKDWKLKRAKRKFEVYLSKNRDRGPYVN